MTLEQQRIKIAEACGWTDVSDWGAAGINGRHPPEPWVEVIPDYLNDLNAMNDAEKSLVSLPDMLNYLHLLSPIHSEWTLATATASERAKAFLKALDLWKETT